MPVKVVLCGAPNSGKSCLREGLKRAILAKDLDYPYPYCLPANPDGDGAWYLPAMWQHETEATAYRLTIKKAFSPQFAELTAEWVAKCRLPLVLVDIGGCPDLKNLEICSTATHAVILWRDRSDSGIRSKHCDEPNHLGRWQQFCNDAHLKIIAEIQSDHSAAEDNIEKDESDRVLRGIVHRLDRRESCEDRPMIQALAERVLELTGKKPMAGAAGDPYLLTPSAPNGNTIVLLTGFGRPASSPDIVRSAIKQLGEMLPALPSECNTLLLDGPLPVLAASALAWEAMQRFPVIGVFDPRANHYVIAYANGKETSLGWQPEPGAVLDLGAIPKAPKRRPSTAEYKSLFYFQSMPPQRDATRVEVRPTDESVDGFELVPAALHQLAEMPSITPGVLFDGKMPVIVAAALTCAAMQRFEYVAFLDPKLTRFVVSASKTRAKPAGMQL